MQGFLGKIEELDYTEFYKLFSRGIFRTSLLDLLTKDIEDDSDPLQKELPM